MKIQIPLLKEFCLMLSNLTGLPVSLQKKQQLKTYAANSHVHHSCVGLLRLSSDHLRI